ncbi:MAG: hypothetical protein ACK2UO_21695 [Caldilineaceae bacterium]
MITEVMPAVLIAVYSSAARGVPNPPGVLIAASPSITLTHLILHM